MRNGKLIGSLSWRPSGASRRLISSWHQDPTRWSGGQRCAETIAIVMSGQGIDPVEVGLVESLARPGGNVTGLTNLTGELGGKRLECSNKPFPKLLVSRLSTIRLLGSVRQRKEDSPKAARALGLTIQLWRYGRRTVSRGYSPRWAKSVQMDSDVLGGTLMRANEKRILGFALKSRLPAMYFTREFVDAVGLTYWANLADSDRRVHTTWTRS